MAGNVLSMIETGIPSSPDVAALNAMSDPLVMVHRMIPRGGNKREAVIVINALTGLKPKQILKLQDAVVDTSKYPDGGPGLYRFEVTDQQTTAKVVWETRIGGKVDDDEVSPVAPGTRPIAIDPNIPAAPDTVSLGNGYVFNSRFRLLTIPDGRILQWDPSQPLPDLAPSFSRAPAGGPATSLGAAMFGPVAPSPETEALRAEVQRLKDEQREQARQRELSTMEDRHRQEMASLRDSMQSLVEKLTAKPAEDPQVVELRRKLEETQRQDSLRAEFNAKIDSLVTLVRESQASRSDPMVSALTNLLGQQTASAKDNLQLMRDVMNQQSSTAQMSAMTPEKLLGFMQQIKDSGSSLINEKIVGLVSGLMDTMLRFRQAESAMSGGGGTNWMELIERLAERASGAVQAFGQAKARQAGADTAKAQAQALRIQQEREREARAATRVSAAQAARTELPPAPSAEVKPQLSGEAARDALAEEVLKRKGGGGTVTPIKAAVAEEPPSAPAAPPAPEPPQIPIKVDRKNPLAKMSNDQLRELYGKIPDEDFFGPFFEVVGQLREALEANPNSVSPDEVAEYVMQSRQQIVQAVQETGQTPIVVSMLAYGRFAYMFERMAPSMAADYWNAAAVALKAKVTAEREASKTS